MRRARAKLQVSTFPFLAVLLGAMGALILLLLIMDRRSKIAARNKVLAAQESRRAELARLEAERKKADEERLAAWHSAEADSKRRSLEEHARLERLHGGLHEDLRGVRGALDKSGRAAEDQEKASQTLRAHQEALRLLLNQRKQELEDKRQDALRMKDADEKLTMELARLAEELGRLEAILRDLKDRRGRESNVYSLVPYRGRNGADRKPIYVECERKGLVFQPEGVALLFPELTPARIAEEITRRGGAATPLAAKKGAATVPARPEPPPIHTGPYVLCLIRPDGIESYERLWSALQDSRLDFGYELVDADWQLDFTPPTSLAATDKLPDPRKSKTLTALPTGRGSGTSAGKEVFGPPGTGTTSPGDGALGKTGVGLPATTLPGVSLGVPVAPPGGVGTGVGAPPKVGPIASAPPTAKGSEPIASKAGEPLKAGEPPAPRERELDWRAAGTPKDTKGGPAPGADPGGKAAEGGDADARPALGPVVKAPRPASLGHLLGNRDLNITLACTESEVILTNTGQKFVFGDGEDAQRRTAEAILETVKNLIARRQASLRPGETPFRPRLHFQVYGDGLRTYYRAYPLIATLRHPMTRENVE